MLDCSCCGADFRNVTDPARKAVQGEKRGFKHSHKKEATRKTNACSQVSGNRNSVNSCPVFRTSSSFRARCTSLMRDVRSIKSHRKSLQQQALAARQHNQNQKPGFRILNQPLMSGQIDCVISICLAKQVIHVV